MAYQIPQSERFTALCDAILSLDPTKFQRKEVLMALAARDRAEVAFRLVRAMEDNDDLRNCARMSPAKDLLNWPEIHVMAERYLAKLKKSGELYPRPVLTGFDLVVAGLFAPTFPGSVRRVVREIYDFVRDDLRTEPLNRHKPVSKKAGIALCSLARRYPELSARLAKRVPSNVFSEEEFRPAFTAWVRNEIGLFASTLPV